MTKEMKQNNMVNRLIKPYPGQWVALSQDDTRVVSVAKSVQTVLNKARKNGESCPHVIKVPDGSVAAYIF